MYTILFFDVISFTWKNGDDDFLYKASGDTVSPSRGSGLHSSRHLRHSRYRFTLSVAGYIQATAFLLLHAAGLLLAVRRSETLKPLFLNTSSSSSSYIIAACYMMLSYYI